MLRKIISIVVSVGAVIITSILALTGIFIFWIQKENDFFDEHY